MANIRKRSLPSGLIRWEVAYIDGGGERRAKLFATKTAAASWLIEVQHDLKRGLHTASSVSPTVKEAAALWIERCKAKQLEATTVKGYEEHIDLHIVPFIGAKKLADLTVPAVNAFADELGKAGRSGAMIKKIVRSLGSVFKEARRRGLSNVAPTIGLDLDLPERADPRPVIPTKPELQAIIAKATERASRLWRAPVRLLGLETDNQALDLLRQLVGIAHRPPRAIAQGLKPVLLVAIENLVAGLAAPIICVQGLRWAAPRSTPASGRMMSGATLRGLRLGV